MRVLIVHQAVSADARADEQDVLAQVAYVETALQELGHVTSRLPVPHDLFSFDEQCRAIAPDMVFNLVESLGNTDSRMAEVPLRLEQIGLPYTGASASAIIATNHKVRAKERLRAAGLPTPDWATIGQGELKPPFILKAIEEHASLHMDDSCVIRDGAAGAKQLITERNRRHAPTTFFAEQFIAGREFNISLLAGNDGPSVLPLAEIDFSEFPPTEQQIVGWAAKWEEQSFAYHNTPRVWLDESQEPKLADSLRTLARACWREFGLSGYARVDFRVDASGQPWILEVNCNPCLAPDAGFAAALTQQEIPWPEAVSRILIDAQRTKHA